MNSHTSKGILETARFLIVDDELANVRLLELMLEQWSCYCVRSTTDARQTLALYQECQPDVVLLDLMMPEMDGFQVMAQLRNLISADEYVPILALTADTSEAIKRRALAGGAKDFLIKPFDEVELRLRICNLFEARWFFLQLQNQQRVLEQKVEERTRELAQSRQQLRALVANQSATIEEERTHIAREVHDVLGQALTGLKIDTSWLGKRISTGELQPDLFQPKLRAMSETIDSTIQSVQRIATKLRPAVLDDFGLEAAIESHMQEFQEHTGIDCEYVSSLDDMILPSELSTSVFRILQESLNNIVRHAAASRVDVLIEENNGYLMLEVQDNGRGINSEEMFAVGSLGLLGMQERAKLLGGTVEISGRMGKGTTVTVTIPLRRADSHE